MSAYNQKKRKGATMKKRTVFIILLFSLLFDVQRVSAATTPNLHTVNGTIISIDNNVIYWSDGSDTYYFYSENSYTVGDKIINVMDENNKHVFIGVNENA